MLVTGNLGSMPASDRTRTGPGTSPLPNSVWPGPMGALVLPLTIGGKAKVTVHWGGRKRGRERVGGIRRNARWRIHRSRSRGWRAAPVVPKDRNLQLKSKAREFGLGDWGVLHGLTPPFPIPKRKKNHLPHPLKNWDCLSGFCIVALGLT
jgi:hypothetical protein